MKVEKVRVVLGTYTMGSLGPPIKFNRKPHLPGPLDPFSEWGSTFSSFSRNFGTGTLTNFEALSIGLKRWGTGLNPSPMKWLGLQNILDPFLILGLDH